VTVFTLEDSFFSAVSFCCCPGSGSTKGLTEEDVDTAAEEEDGAVAVDSTLC